MRAIHTKTPRFFLFLQLCLFPGLIAACLALSPCPARAADVYGIPEVDDGSTYTVGAADSPSAVATGTDTAYGADLESSGLVNSGTISGSSKSGYTYGVEAYSNSTVTNNKTISATNDSGKAYGADLYSSTLTNSGTISGSSKSGYTYGVAANSNSTVTNNKTISATSDSGEADGVFLYSSSLTNSGTISASGGTGSYAIYAFLDSTVTLATGTRILSGSVYSQTYTNTLKITSDSPLNFALAGAWKDITLSGVGAWTLNSGCNASTDTLTLASGSTMVFPTDSALTVNGTATLDGTLLIDPKGAGTGTILTAGTLNTGAGYRTGSTNPNFRVDVATSSNAMKVTTTFAPQADAASLATTVASLSAQAFAGVAQARDLTMLTMLADADKADDGDVMVASNGSLSGLLDEREPERPWSVFVQPVYNSTSRDGTAGQQGYDANMTGLEAGIDRRIGDNMVLGAMVGIGLTDIEFNGSDFVNNDSEDQRLYTAGLYGGYAMGDWLFADVVSTTYVTHDSKRNAGAGQIAKADYDSWLTANQLLAVYRWHPSAQWEIAPRAGLNVTYLHWDAFSETGAVNAVSYDDLDKVFADGLLGVRATHAGFQVEDTLITPYAGAGLIHSLGANDITVRQYLPTTSAQVTTENDSDRLTTECGVTFGKGPASLTLAYSGEYGDTLDSHSIFGLLRWAF
jgi:uncharacterized protein with beta-barrel porin domain